MDFALTIWHIIFRPIQSEQRMKYTLTSWKEIAQYVGKGVRTVQRWEQILELPVHRPRARNRGMVLAAPEEIDAWLVSTTQRKSDSELVKLRKQVSELGAEVASLRQQLRDLTNGTDRDASLALPPDDEITVRDARVLARATQLRLDAAESIEMARNLRFLRQEQRAQLLQIAERIGKVQSAISRTVETLSKQ